MYNDSEIYERLAIGLGDAIMLRPAILNNMGVHPEKNHILFAHPQIVPIFFDIDKLIIIPVKDGNTIKEKQWYSRSILESFSNYKYYQLSNPCAEYESKNEPNILKSRQQIYCDVVGDNFDYRRYDVKFIRSELEFAEIHLDNTRRNIGFHLDSNDGWRDYRPKNLLVQYFAKNLDCNIYVFGQEHKSSIKKNIHYINEKNIRNIWALISKMDAFIGIDSFGVHAGGSVGVKTFGIFGSTDPRIRLLYPRVRWLSPYKYCPLQYCWYHAISHCKHKWCLNSISPKVIFNEFMNFYREE